MTGRTVLHMEWLPELPGVVAESFFTYAQKGRTIHEPVKEISELFASEFGANFMAGGRPEAWAPLADATIASRQGSSGLFGSDTATLEDIADKTTEELAAMASSFTPVGSASMDVLNRSGALEDSASNPDSWTVVQEGSNSAYASFQDTSGHGAFHLFGRTSPTEMPVRDWSYVSDEAIAEGEQILAAWLAEE